MTCAPLLITGPMFSGKTSTAINSAPYGRRIYHPHKDTRATNAVTTHDGRSYFAYSGLPDLTSQWLKDTHLLIDEAQFYDLDELCNLLAVAVRVCRSVTVCMLSHDAEGKLWENFSTVKAIIEGAGGRTVYLTAPCEVCGSPARYTRRKPHVESAGRIQCGGAELYEPICWDCWSKS